MLEQLKARVADLLQQVEQSVIKHHSLLGAFEEAKTAYNMFEAAEKAKNEVLEGEVVPKE